MSARTTVPKKKQVKKTEVEPAVAPVAPVAPVVPAPVAPVVTAPKKGKKAVKIVAVVNANGIEGSFAPEPRRPLIAHLQVHSSEVKFHDMPLKYDPTPPSAPEPYDVAVTNYFTTQQEPLLAKVEEEEVKEQTPVAAPAVATGPMPSFIRSGLMLQYKESATAKQIPTSTEIACFWCTQSFEGQPYVIPEREEKGVYRVYGNFCCPECGVAYLLREPMDPHVRWERMALLHRIYDVEGRERIFPAPARETLKIFGGPMSIETFRATVRSAKVRVDLHMPPMVSILGSIDTKPIDFFDSNLRSTFIQGGVAVAEKPASTGEENLRLKRSKPLKDPMSTLDSVMNIRIRTGGKN
jgi:hypothetical protein